MSPFYQHKIIAITGATSGIGRALALQLLQKGAKVAICGRDENKLNEMRAEANNADLLCIQADISQEADCKQFIEQTVQQLGGIDVLINNAGISMRALFEEVDLKVLKQSMDINYWGTVYCCKYALPHILKSKGSIAGISSVAGYKGLPCRTGYSSSKFAMQGFLESLRIELLHRKVNVLWISPGFVASNIRNVALNADGKAQKETPLNEKGLMSAEECAHGILQAIEKRKRSLIMTFQGKLTVWMNTFFPSFVDRQVYKHFANEPDSPLK
ncbi:MAG: SDR family oxidoreductase [Bacteroidetes bacterium]|nr:SDR family oxidoreductase [Bacteroidota bacterium]MBK8144004.1 SDR family oxidoreductase [Bacteroidota bacterium]MBP6316009.1 SDR family oxidoreductase [Chitinophagaceae bacterium]